jgi:hypothetical protein
MLEHVEKAIDRAISVVQEDTRPGRKFLFERVEPLFFALTQIHKDYLKEFDRAIGLMEASEDSPEAVYKVLQQISADFLPIRQKVNVLTTKLKAVVDKEGFPPKDPFADLIRVINWYFHMGFGGIAKSRLKMASYNCLYDVLQDWRGDFPDYALLEEARKIRSGLVNHWATVCTSYTRVKLDYLDTE